MYVEYKNCVVVVFKVDVGYVNTAPNLSGFKPVLASKLTRFSRLASLS